jgi:hypothetical protein
MQYRNCTARHGTRHCDIDCAHTPGVRSLLPYIQKLSWRSSNSGRNAASVSIVFHCALARFKPVSSAPNTSPVSELERFACCDEEFVTPPIRSFG